MSTACKLDRRVREARYRRRTLVDYLIKASDGFPKAVQRAEAIRLAHQLDHIRRCSNLTGGEKEEKFQRSLNWSPIASLLR
jgi:hypothetical protein